MLKVPLAWLANEQFRFKTAVDFYPNQTLFMVTQPGDVSYTGTGAHVDAAWEALIWGRYFSISEAEATALWGAEGREQYRDRMRGGFTGG